MKIRLEAFDPVVAALVSSWASTGDEVRRWCSRDQAPVPADVVAGWSQADDAQAFVLLDDGEVVGYGELWVDDDEAEVELARLIVSPGRRRRGLGRRMVMMLAEQAKSTYPDVFLRVVPDNVAARRCYASAGFLQVPPEDEEEWNKGQPHDYVWMTR